jgi:hypothetical protein
MGQDHPLRVLNAASNARAGVGSATSAMLVHAKGALPPSVDME